MKVICTTVGKLPKRLSQQTRAFTFFELSGAAGVGSIANKWPAKLKRAGHAPSPNVWDFVLFSFAVCAADLVVQRNGSADGWTREIELEVSLNRPRLWEPHTAHLQDMLRVLTGDFWTLKFLPGGPRPPNGRRKLCDRDCVALLSGGLDSLIGGIDLQAADRHPIFVSQLAHEDSERQRNYARALGGATWHQQWSHAIGFDGKQEPSTRARSMAFYGLAVLASALLTTPGPHDIIVPENGFISVNPPLLPGRMSSLSTRTTHPLFMRKLAAVLPALGIDVNILTPYQFKTKGEMLAECIDPNLLLQRYASDTTSCGRFRTYNRTHCGRCVPCMVRRAAFLHWGPNKDLTRYKFGDLSMAGKTNGDDAIAVACAALQVRSEGIDRMLGATLSFAHEADRPRYRRVLDQGLSELTRLLQNHRLL